MFRRGTDLLCIYVALRLSYSGPGLEGSHQPSSGKQQTTGQQGGASVVSRLTEGLCETLFCLFRGSLYVGLLCRNDPNSDEILKTVFEDLFDKAEGPHGPVFLLLFFFWFVWFCFLT